MFFSSFARLAALVAVAAILAAPVSSSTAGAVADEARAESPAPHFATGAAAELAPFQRQLLDLAYDATTRMPVRPHIRNRSRGQHRVCVSALAMGQPGLALEYADGIENWYRGMVYADVAYHWAERGETALAEALLPTALEVAETTEDWRRDSIRVRAAQTGLLLGDGFLAAEVENDADLAFSEMGKVEVTRARARRAAFEDEVAALRALAASELFDTKINALEAMVHLHGRVYGRAEQARAVEELLRSSWEFAPAFMRFELVISMGENALGHGDAEGARAFAAEAREVVDTHNWPMEKLVEYQATTAKLRARAGDTETALAEAAEALANYEEGHLQVFDIWRATALRPIAEAYATAGDRDNALRVYKMAVEAGIANPNSRPRADDLNNTCISMARYGVQPDTALWAKLHEIQSGLSDPW